MTKTQTHIIKTQVLDLQLSSKENAFEQQTAFRDMFIHKLLPQLSDFFDEIAPPGLTLVIDHLEVDLGEIDLTKTDEHSLKIMAEKMKRSLIKQIDNLTQSRNPSIHPAVLKGIRLLLFFLENGHFPWWQTHLNSNDFEQLILVDLKNSTADVKQLMKVFFRKILLSKNKNQLPFKRLVFQFSDHTISEVLKVVFEQKSVFIPNKKTAAFRLQHWETTTLRLLKPIKETVQKKLKPHEKQTEQNKIIHSKEHVQNDGLKTKNTAKTTKEKEIMDTVKLEEVTSKKKASARDGYYIRNSGLVIIAPYLDHFFTALNLMKNKTFICEAAQIRAIHLLQYLATFEEDTPEYDLILNKILCGISLEKPVLKSVQLTTIEKKEARNLLKAIVRNWPALKNTSPEGLQEGFLRREGKLIQKKATEKWVLQVEGKAHDILLGKLPWTYSMIKQSWMANMLTVEWL